MRERLWFSGDEIRAALPQLKSAGFHECVLFSTCNRTELYTFSSEKDLRVKFLADFLREQKSVSQDVPASRFFSFLASGAAEHLFQVASGIDSMVVGDVQIQAQVKEAYSLAHDSGTAGFFMNKLFQSAFHVGKRARSETQISEGAISVSYAAVELAERIFDDLHRKKALVIGAGETAQLTAKHLAGKGIGTLHITNRTAERSEQLAKMVGGTTLPFESFREKLAELDIIVSSIQSDGYVLTADDIAKINKGRHSGALFLIDIGVPRNIDPAARDLENVFLYDIDSLNGMVNETIQRRQAEIPHIKQIIAEELAELYKWHTSLQANPTIAALTEHLEGIRSGEVTKNINRFDQKDRELVELLTKRIVNKILHTPIVNLRNGQDESVSDRLQKINIVRRLFGIDSGHKDRSDEH
jgi:glutamyl-tRNA reductase